MKPRLVSFATDVNQLFISELRPWLADHFEFGHYDYLRSYDPRSTVFVANQYQYSQDRSRIDQLIDSGYRCIFENLLEMPPMETAAQGRDRTLHLHCTTAQAPGCIGVPAYIWIWSYLKYSTSWQPDLSARVYDAFDLKFLLLMKELRPFRSEIFDLFGPILDQAVYSYVGRGLVLAAELEPMTPTWEFRINTAWYNRTAVSVVVETNMFDNSDNIFVTEKTYKPMLMGHPWAILSSPGSVELLKSWGFLSYDNLFEESYDAVDSISSRMYQVYMAIKNLNIDHYDAETLERIAHNQAWFGNKTKLQELCRQQLIDPVLEWIAHE